MDMRSFRLLVTLSFAFSLSALFLTFYIIDAGIGFEANPIQGFFIANLGKGAIFEVIAIWSFVIFVYERFHAKHPKATLVSSLLILLMTFIDFLHDLLIVI